MDSTLTHHYFKFKSEFEELSINFLRHELVHSMTIFICLLTSQQQNLQLQPYTNCRQSTYVPHITIYAVVENTLTLKTDYMHL